MHGWVTKNGNLVVVCKSLRIGLGSSEIESFEELRETTHITIAHSVRSSKHQMRL